MIDAASPEIASESRRPARHRRASAVRTEWLSVLAHLGVFGLVIEVAFVHLGVADAAPDEYTYRACGIAYVHGHLTCNLEHPLLAKEILGIGSVFFGDSLTAARATTAIFAVATAYFCYLFCRDAAGRVAGLVAAAMWGLLPQVGIEDHTTLEAVRVDRYALLDPYVACFVALALVGAARLARRGGIRPALLTGAAVAAAACAKAPGALIAPVLCIVPLAVRRRVGAPIRRDVGALVLGAVAVGIASYAPLGPTGAVRAIRYMFDFQSTHVAREVIVGGHYYVTAPWWSDLFFASTALTVPVAITLGSLALIGVALRPRAAGIALGASASILLGVGFGLHLSAPHYFIDWEPGVVIAASLGIVALARVRVRLVAALAVVATAVLLVGVIEVVRDANAIAPGPYRTASEAMQCERTCLVAYVGFLDVFASYVPKNEYLSAVPPSTRAGHVVARVRSDGRTTYEEPDVIALDPAAYVLHGSWRTSIRYFEAHFTTLGYVRMPSGSRIQVFRHITSSAFDPPGRSESHER